MAQTRYTTLSTRSRAAAPNSFRMGTPGTKARKPAMAPPTASLELASTRSSLCSTTAGTMAALATV